MFSLHYFSYCEMIFRKSSIPKRQPFTAKLSEEQLEQYHSDGFLVLRGFLNRRIVKQGKQALSDVIRRHIESSEVCCYEALGSEEGKLTAARYCNRHSPFFFQLEPGWDPEGKSSKEIELAVSKLMNHHTEHQVFHQIGPGNVDLLRLIGQIFEDYAVLYQSVAFVKPALIGSEKPWHQDNAYFRMQDLEKVIGVWIALDRATKENACMHVLKGGHRLGPLRHQIADECEIKKDRFDRAKAIPVEMEPGDILIFHSNLPHMTPANNSPYRRRSVQYHFRAEGNTMLSYLDYEKVFKEADGTPASCAAAQARGL